MQSGIFTPVIKKFGFKMLYDKLRTAWENCDVESEMALYHSDYEFKFHSTGDVMRKSDINLDTRLAFMKAIKQNNPRCIYENDDIIVAHNITDFPNGTTDAVMMVHLKKDGLIWRTETGSTPIPK